MTDDELRAEATSRGMVLTSLKFWEAAADAIRFMVAELKKREGR